MSNRSPELLIDDILEAIAKIELFIANLSKQQFESDDKTTDAVVRNLEIIGEAANRLPKNAQVNYPNIEWSKIVGLRHRIVHDYFGIDLDIVWSILQSDLPRLKAALKK